MGEPQGYDPVLDYVQQRRRGQGPMTARGVARDDRSEAHKALTTIQTHESPTATQKVVLDLEDRLRALEGRASLAAHQKDLALPADDDPLREDPEFAAQVPLRKFDEHGFPRSVRGDAPARPPTPPQPSIAEQAANPPTAAELAARRREAALGAQGRLEVEAMVSRSERL